MSKKGRLIEKPWGHEKLLEHNDKYVMKELFMKAGERCSLQYHEHKQETVYVVSGILKLLIGPDKNNLKERKMKSHSFITINPKQVHRMEAIEDCLYLEASTPELDDVVRISDDYNRK